MPTFNSSIAIASQLQAKDLADSCTVNLVCVGCGNSYFIPIFLGFEDFFLCSICDSLIWTKQDCHPLSSLSYWQSTLKR